MIEGDFAVGDVFRWMGQKVHVVGVMDAGDEYVVVFKAWSKFRWNYDVQPSWAFRRYAEKGKP